MGNVLQCCCYTYNPSLNVSNNMTDVGTDYLYRIEYKDTTVFTFPIKYGKVIKVYDGDTITIATKVPGLENSEIYKFSVRLNGIDTPEMKTKNQDEKNIAQLAQRALSEKILNKDVILKDVKTEKYGRLLCEVYLDNIHLNNWLLENRFAIAYGGGTKTIPTSWEKYHKEGVI